MLNLGEMFAVYSGVEKTTIGVELQRPGFHSLGLHFWSGIPVVSILATTDFSGSQESVHSLHYLHYSFPLGFQPHSQRK